VAKGLRALREATEADEILVTTITYDHAGRVRSHQLLARERGQAYRSRPGNPRAGCPPHCNIL